MNNNFKNGYKKLVGILSKEQSEILEAAVFLMLPSFLTKISGLIFSLLAASYFGTDDPGWNQFLIANSIPELLATVLLFGTVGAVLIPILITCRNKEGKEYFFKVYSSIINMSIIAFAIVSVIFVIYVDDIFPFLLEHVIRPINEPKPEEVGIIVNMMRVLLIPQIILGISVFVSSGLNVYNRFLVPQLAPLFYNVGRIIAIFTIVPLMNYSPWALVIGVFIGSVLHLFIQLPLFKSVGLKYEFVIHPKDDYMKEIVVIGMPRLLALASEQIAFTINKFIAYGVNGIAALTYANQLSLVIPSLFGYTFSVAAFPTLSKLFVDGNYEEIKNVVNKILNQILFLSLPFTITLLILRVPVTRLIFGLMPNTSLDLAGTYQIAWVILWFSLSWVFVSGKWFMYRLFYAVKDTFIPLVVSAISLVLTVVLSILLTNLFSHSQMLGILSIEWKVDNFFTRSSGDASVGGIALGMTIAYSLEFILLLVIFNYRKINLGFKSLLLSTSKKFIAGLFMFVTMYFMYKTWNTLSYTLPDRAHESYTGSTTLNLMLLTSTTVATSFLVYYLICYLLKVEELKILKRYLNPLFRIGGFRIH